MNNSINEWLAQAAADLEKQSAEYEAQQHLEPATIQKAKDGAVAAILELKRLAKNGDERAKAALEPLYYDGNKDHAVGTVVFRENITSIEDEAFRDCTGLKVIVLPDSLTSIGAWAFNSCSSLKEIHLPNRLTSIGACAFLDCSGLKEIVLPKGLATIGKSAFSYCRSLEKIILPAGLTFIGEYAFLSCGVKSIAYYKKTEWRLKNWGGLQWNSVEKTILD